MIHSDFFQSVEATQAHVLRVLLVFLLFSRFACIQAHAEAPPDFIKAWGNDDSVLHNPGGVAADIFGNVYAIDGGEKIKKFDVTGHFIVEWKIRSSNDDECYPNASAITVDNAGDIYAASSNCIKKFDNSGHAIFQWKKNTGSGDGELSFSSGIAIDSKGSVYVSDTGNNRIQVFDSTGHFLFLWGTWGHEAGQFDQPNGIAIDAADNIFIVDTWNNRIQKFDNTGHFLAQWGTPGEGIAQFQYPRGISIDFAGNVFVTDTYNARVQKFDGAGNFIAKWGIMGSGSGQLREPSGIAVDASGNVHVADPFNHRIQIFNHDGLFLSFLGTSFSNDGYFQEPTGIAVDAAGIVYVIDSGNHRIQTFDSEGNFLAKWGGEGNGDGQFKNPYGIAMDATGYIYGTDTYNSRVQKFDNAGNFLAKWGEGGYEDGNFIAPTGIAVDRSGYVYVISNYRIQIFDQWGHFLSKWEHLGLFYPYGVAVNSEGFVYATDTEFHRILTFDSAGNQIGIWGGRSSSKLIRPPYVGGSGDGQFSGPKGITVDTADNVYVADTNNQRIQKFDKTGHFLSKWGSGIAGDVGLTPQGIAVDASGNVYVADTFNHRIQKFSYSPSSTPPIITPIISGALGKNGWYSSNVRVRWVVTDAQSPILSQAGCRPNSLKSDTSGRTFTCQATSEGGTTTRSISIQRDTKRPQATAKAATNPHLNGWYNQDVVVNFSGTDVTSGIASCTAPITLTTEGNRRSASGTCEDKAGNQSKPARLSRIKIDKTNPTVNISSPQSGAVYALNQRVVASYRCSDALSGIAGCSGTVGKSKLINTSVPVANASFVVMAKDRAGNIKTEKITYSVK